MVVALAFQMGSAVAQRPGLLDRVAAGEWELRDREGSAGRTRICVRSGWQLVQVRHQREQCRSFVIEETPGTITVQYTCPGNGYGRTHIRLESGQLAQLETQGISAGLPFLFMAEARRLGDCDR